ncbi:hypothetical protein F0U44_15035 [Nocardioides humilatus]|uniref:Uncharacterized protein n=1 Tax=Nocardioides humilatus TaxID=2607660 RepID=A0A5B1LCL2_9ACTN|nr:hypothetical protein [Nocardioides humilatus]KAA1417948.1 hypothetical protein F0U44_15035 [Nocardioides humilatus]
MDHHTSTTTRRKHLLTDAQLAVHAGATPDDLTHGHRQGNGMRVHRAYIVVVSITALICLVIAMAMASGTM